LESNNSGYWTANIKVWRLWTPVLLNMLKIRKPQLNLLEKLTNATAVSGDEGAIRKIVRVEVENIADEIKTDAMGNLLVTKRGKGRNRLKIMLAAHMDEIGFMLVN